MTWIWLLLASVAVARDRDSSADADPLEVQNADLTVPVKHRGRVHVPPIRVETRAALREEVGAALILELGVQVARTERSALDLNLAYAAPRGIRVPGPWRSYSACDLTADYQRSLSRWFAVGPVAGVSYRMYSQQGRAIGAMYTPIAGLRSETALVRARKWSVVIDAGATVDLSLTRMVLETSRVENLQPVEGQVGLRWNFGHGVPPSGHDNRVAE